jgi:hypothetical protein
MKLSVTRNDVYVPKWNGNSKLPDDEKVKVHYHFLSFEEQESIVSVDSKGETRLNFAKGVAAQVDKIENLVIESDGEETAITTGAELVAEPAVDQLALEVWRHLNSVNPTKAAKS